MDDDGVVSEVAVMVKELVYGNRYSHETGQLHRRVDGLIEWI